MDEQDFIFDGITQEMLDVAEVDPNFDTRTFKIRCTNCQRTVEATLKRVIEVIKLHRYPDIMTIKSQKHVRIPFLGLEFTITFWNVTKNYHQPRIFIR